MNLDYEEILKAVKNLDSPIHDKKEFCIFKDIILKDFCETRNIPLSIFDSITLENNENFKNPIPFYNEPFVMRSKTTGFRLVTADEQSRNSYVLPLAKLVKKLPNTFYSKNQNPPSLMFFVYEFAPAARVSNSGIVSLTGGCNYFQIALSIWYICTTIETVVNEIILEECLEVNIPPPEHPIKFKIINLHTQQILATNVLYHKGINCMKLASDVLNKYNVPYRFPAVRINFLFITPFSIRNDDEKIYERKITICVSPKGGINITGVKSSWAVQLTACLTAFLIKDCIINHLDYLPSPIERKMAMDEFRRIRETEEIIHPFRTRLQKIKTIQKWIQLSPYKSIQLMISPDPYPFNFPPGVPYRKVSIKEQIQLLASKSSNKMKKTSFQHLKKSKEKPPMISKSTLSRYSVPLPLPPLVSFEGDHGVYNNLLEARTVL